MISLGQTVSSSITFIQKDFDCFAALSGDDNPIHVDPKFSAHTKFGKTVAHGMLLYSAICRVLGEQMPGQGTWHLAQELMFPSPTFPDEETTINITVTNIYEQGYVELSTSIQKHNGEESCRGKALVRTEFSPNFTFPLELMPWRTDSYSSETAQMKGLILGQSESLKRVFKLKDIESYSHLTGDNNPLYCDLSYANSVGLNSPLIPPPLLASLFSTLLGTKLPGRGTNWLKQKLNFLLPVSISLSDNDIQGEIVAHVEVVRLRQDKELVNLHTYCTNSQGEMVCDGEVLVLVKDLEINSSFF
jgi:acyl dehydratase